MSDRWWERAACRTRPWQWWFPTHRDSPSEARQGKAICWGECPTDVRRACLKDADGRDFDANAIRGGWTADERGWPMREAGAA